MCTRILKKESSSRALSLLLLLLMMPLGFISSAQNCTAMEHAQDEESPLLINESKREKVEDLSPMIRSLPPVFDNIEEANVAYRRLNEADREEALRKRTEAEKKMKDIIDFISLHHNKKFFERLQKKHQAEAEKANISIETVEALLKYLEDLSWKAINEKPSLADYMKDGREQKESLIVDVEALIEECVLLRRQNEVCSEYFKKIFEKKKLESKKDIEIVMESEPDNQTNKVLQRENSILRYIVTPASFVLGVLLGGMGTGLTLYFMWR